jgi:NitT/TauT family transport system permease protein
MMISMSGGWFFVVASEAITVGNTTFTLPGIGSYVAEAIAQRNLHAVGWAILTMFLVILLYDQLLFRPLVIWSDKFRFEQTVGQDAPSSWVTRLFMHTQLIKRIHGPLSRLSRWMLNWRFPALHRMRLPQDEGLMDRVMDGLWYLPLMLIIAFATWKTTQFVFQTLSLADLGIVVRYSFFTLLRVTILIFLASLIWVPVGVWAGLHPRVALFIQPIAQFLAAFPANLLFPVAVMTIVHYHLMPDIWLSPLIILGTQWYILFNVIAGTKALPNDMKEAATSFHIRGWLWWKTVILPGIFPYYVTGAITASGGSWNASIVAEIVSWGPTTVTAHGIGAYIAQATARGDYPRIVLGIAVMAAFVIFFNRVVWYRLYNFAERRFRLD